MEERSNLLAVYGRDQTKKKNRNNTLARTGKEKQQQKPGKQSAVNVMANGSYMNYDNLKIRKLENYNLLIFVIYLRMTLLTMKGNSKKKKER